MNIRPLRDLQLSWPPVFSPLLWGQTSFVLRQIVLTGQQCDSVLLTNSDFNTVVLLPGETFLNSTNWTERKQIKACFTFIVVATNSAGRSRLNRPDPPPAPASSHTVSVADCRLRWSCQFTEQPVRQREASPQALSLHRQSWLASLLTALHTAAPGKFGADVTQLFPIEQLSNSPLLPQIPCWCE